jgi:hypothetical protein
LTALLIRARSGFSRPLLRPTKNGQKEMM